MSKVYLISDLHLGHDKILHFSPNRGGSNTKEHDEWLVAQWNSIVTKRDTVWVLGDVAFNKEALTNLSKMKGNKILLRGNHDKFALQDYLKYFSDIYGIVKKNGFWLSHAPVHPQELRGMKNIHGHVHNNSIVKEHHNLRTLDNRYINVCVEALNGIPVSFEEIIEKNKSV